MLPCPECWSLWGSSFSCPVLSLSADTCPNFIEDVSVGYCLVKEKKMAHCRVSTFKTNLKSMTKCWVACFPTNGNGESITIYIYIYILDCTKLAWSLFGLHHHSAPGNHWHGKVVSGPFLSNMHSFNCRSQHWGTASTETDPEQVPYHWWCEDLELPCFAAFCDRRCCALETHAPMWARPQHFHHI